ncbi:MAG: cell division ATP-binding protein FtsE [Coriobacteriales bacterium]|nr:cell division ATP-binding protein FtsE [Coriobacteriales bacterium]MDO5708889.1 cell division ATP-binding protein FtsE [Coriobacteriales bacterium]
MASHFRNSERQGEEELTQEATANPQAPEVQTVYPTVNEDEVDAIVSSLSAAAVPEPIETLVTPTVEEAEPMIDATAERATGAFVVPDPLAEPATPDAAAIPDPLAEPAPVADPFVGAVQDAVARQDTGTARPFIDEPAPAVSREGTPTISLRNVTVIYPSQPNKPALDDVSLDIYPGEFVFLVGHSGSGKSTFIRLLNRELRATSGKVMVAGQELTKMRNWKVPYLRRQIGCVFQDFKLLPDKTTYENVAFALECIGKPKSVINVQVPEVLRLVGLAERMDAYPDQLSGGEQQRVSVARAMVNRPPLLICDEPTGNLDPAISLGIMKLLDRINRTGTTVVVATHDREMVNTMRRRVIALEAGHLVRDQEKGGYGNYGVR